MRRVVVLGKRGQLGQALLAQLQASETDVVALDRQTLDLTQVAQIPAVLDTLQPDVIINAAAYTQVDQAEADAAQADQINHQAVAQLAAVAARCGAQLIHFSTDYVFDGRQGIPWRERDSPNPLSVYGQTKWAGEQAVRQTLPNHHLIIRTAWVYGAGGTGNFVKTMLRLGQSREVIRVVQDQVGTPTWTEDLARTVVASMAQGEAIPPGTYHYTNSGVASWYDFAIAIFEEARALGLPLTVQEIQPIPSQDYPTAAQRPSYSVLDCQKITTLLRQPAPHWRVSLRTMLQQYLQEQQR